MKVVFFLLNASLLLTLNFMDIANVLNDISLITLTSSCACFKLRTCIHLLKNVKSESWLIMHKDKNLKAIRSSTATRVLFNAVMDSKKDNYMITCI